MKFAHAVTCGVESSCDVSPLLQPRPLDPYPMSVTVYHKSALGLSYITQCYLKTELITFPASSYVSPFQTPQVCSQ